MSAAEVRAALAQRAGASCERLVAITRALVATASPNPPSDTHAVAAVAQRLLQDIPGLEI